MGGGDGSGEELWFSHKSVFEAQVLGTEMKRGQERLQKLTDQFIAQVDEIAKTKEREILEP